MRRSIELMVTIVSLITILDRSRCVRSENELELVQVLFAHAVEYPIELSSIIPKLIPIDPTAANLDYLQQDMTNEEKSLIYELGVRLRQRYDQFVGNIYHPETTKSYATDGHSSKMSAILVNAGLWPPEPDQRWSDELNWQPLPLEFIDADKDVAMMGRLCPTFENVTQIVRDLPTVRSLLEKRDELIAHLRKYTGSDEIEHRDVARLYESFEAEADRRVNLSPWSEGIFTRDQMLDSIYLHYDIMSWTNVQKQLNGGGFLKNILENCAARPWASSSRERKITIYSGDPNLLAGVLRALNLWHPRVPNVGAALIFELYRDTETNVRRLKILHDLGEKNISVDRTIPGCDRDPEGCELFQLIRLLRDILPSDEKSLCVTPVERLDLTSFDPTILTMDRASLASLGRVPSSATILILVLAHFIPHSLRRR